MPNQRHSRPKLLVDMPLSETETLPAASSTPLDDPAELFSSARAHGSKTEPITFLPDNASSLQILLSEAESETSQVYASCPEYSDDLNLRDSGMFWRTALIELRLQLLHNSRYQFASTSDFDRFCRLKSDWDAWLSGRFRSNNFIHNARQRCQAMAAWLGQVEEFHQKIEQSKNLTSPRGKLALFHLKSFQNDWQDLSSSLEERLAALSSSLPEGVLEDDDLIPSLTDFVRLDAAGGSEAEDLVVSFLKHKNLIQKILSKSHSKTIREDLCSAAASVVTLMHAHASQQESLDTIQRLLKQGHIDKARQGFHEFKTAEFEDLDAIRHALAQKLGRALRRCRKIEQASAFSALKTAREVATLYPELEGGSHLDLLLQAARRRTLRFLGILGLTSLLLILGGGAWWMRHQVPQSLSSSSEMSSGLIQKPSRAPRWVAGF